jgi:hypothetical protein
MPAARRVSLEEPARGLGNADWGLRNAECGLGGLGNGEWKLFEDVRRGEAAPAKRLRQQLRIADTAEDIARIAPERARLSEQGDGVRMILEVRAVGDRVAGDRLPFPRCGIRRKPVAERYRVDRRMLIEIGERVDRGDGEPRTCG